MFKATYAIFLFIGLNIFWPPHLKAQELFTLSPVTEKAHDPRLYTQGLFMAGEYIYESSGLYGRSLVLKRRLAGGEIVASHALSGEFFAEGAALVGDEVFLLTWRENTLFVLDAETLAVKRQHRYSGEGWGLAFDGERLWRSDGSAYLYPHRPGDFSPAGEPVRVFSGRRIIDALNELEWDAANKLMLANVYGSDYVALIDPATGELKSWLDARPLRGLARGAGLKDDGFNTVLNGLALAPDGRSLWLTGKLWPKMYQVAWPPENLKAQE